MLKFKDLFKKNLNLLQQFRINGIKKIFNFRFIIRIRVGTMNLNAFQDLQIKNLQNFQIIEDKYFKKNSSYHSKYNPRVEYQRELLFQYLCGFRSCREAVLRLIWEKKKKKKKKK